MAFPPVARLLNVVLTSFNQLREVRKGKKERLKVDSKEQPSLSQKSKSTKTGRTRVFVCRRYKF